MRFLALILWLTATGCVGTPLPQPPVLEPPNPDGVLFNGSGSTVGVVGSPGAVAPGIPELWLVNLDGVADPVLATVAEDGSFAVTFESADGDEVRMQARDGELRSDPVDVRVPDSTPSVRSAACLVLDPPLELRFAGTPTGERTPGTITLENTCGAEARIDTADLRRPAPFSVLDATPVIIADGATATLNVEFAPTGRGTQEEILFVQITSPTADRRPITLTGSSP